MGQLSRHSLTGSSSQGFARLQSSLQEGLGSITVEQPNEIKVRGRFLVMKVLTKPIPVGVCGDDFKSTPEI